MAARPETTYIFRKTREAIRLAQEACDAWQESESVIKWEDQNSLARYRQQFLRLCSLQEMVKQEIDEENLKRFGELRVHEDYL